MYDLFGKIALVTGAGGEHGFGRVIAMRLAEEGADVVVNDIVSNPYPNRSRNWRGLPSTVAGIEGLGRRAVAITADISDGAQVERMVRETVAQFGQIDILVANAGSRHGSDLVPVVDLEEEAWDLTMRVNLKGTFLCCKFAAREMVRRGAGGKIIVMSSAVGKRGQARRAAYSASKFALVGFTQTLALELAPYRINVNALCPGIADTERIDFMAATLAPAGETAEQYRTRLIRDRTLGIPLGRVAESSDIARVAAFFASSESDYLTGLSISVTGGAVMD
jgi:NAD(P)-dependent dehydrogenase (short-subunit alcohol dehydrogenase family)